MDFVETVLLRKAGRGRDMLSSAPGGWHHQHQQSPLPTSSAEEEEPCAATDRGGGLLLEDFSVDDLLDLGGGGGKEQNGGAEGEGFLQVGEVEEEEERAGWCNSNASPSTSALSFQAAAFLPSSSDPIVPVRSSSPSMARSSSGLATEEKPNLASLVLRQTQAGDVEDLEWVSRFVDDSYSEFASAALAPPFANLYAPPPAPAAAAEVGGPKAWSTSSGSPLKRPWRSSWFSTASVAVPARARSKRSRTSGRVWSLHGPCLLSEPSSSSCSSASSSSSCSVFSSVTSSLGVGGGNPDRFLHSLGGGPPFLNQRELPQLQVAKKKTGRKPKVPAGDGSGGGAVQETRRRCSHCGVDKTPQWRAGPMGTKTLCNACGVRYKSGRLLPEYRPAGSPTFLSHVHSNSHRKVLEIRRSKELPTGGDAASCSPSPSQQVVEETRPYGVV